MEGFIILIFLIWLVVWLVKSGTGYSRDQISAKTGRAIGRSIVGRGKRRI